MKKVGFLLAGVMALTALATGAQAAEGAFLADRHVARGMKCETCHEPGTAKLKAYKDIDVCAQCHGEYPAMIKKTEGKYETNPHGQHEGALPCSECHKGHKAGVNYCGQCHNFVYKVP